MAVPAPVQSAADMALPTMAGGVAVPVPVATLPPSPPPPADVAAVAPAAPAPALAPAPAPAFRRAKLPCGLPGSSQQFEGCFLHK